MSESTDGPSAVVVGAGIGGLTAAVALCRIGWQVTVLERAPALSEVGAGIALMANALRSLDRLGLADEVRRTGQPQRSGGLRKADGRWLLRMNGSAAEELLGTPIVMLHRGELHRILRSPLPPESVHPGVDVTTVEQDPEGVRVRYAAEEGAAQLPADLVVAADGAHSKVRAQLFPGHPGSTYSGATAWRGVTRAPVDPPPEISQTWAPGHEFGISPLVDGRVYWWGAANAPAGQRYDDEMAEVRRRFGSWADPIPALLDATEPSAVLHHDLFELATPLPSYVDGRVALLGDAAHAMTPYAGQGACQAIEDAVVLAAALDAEPRGVAAALASYDAARRGRTQQVVRAAHLSGRFGHQLENRLAIALRDGAMRLIPARVSLRQMVRFADWTPPPLR